MNLDDYERKLLEGWEEVHKRGQLTLWILLALKNGPKHMSDIKDFIHKTTHGTLTADDKSMYRALRRYTDAEMLDFSNQPSENGGPELKIYRLTPIGKNVLDQFIKRNITSLYFGKNKELFQ
jgi:PadR family transcriptional regulator PadR